MSARGKLRVYSGAAPGVGKTYHMLDEAQRRAERGGDVVVGFVETHGRPHTQAMLDGLEIVPRRRMEYRGADFEEMDIDAILERAPAVVLVDELAHTNVPGSRNAKRWQDVEELLAAGIDVISLGEHPAPGVAQRRRAEDHRGAAARDRAGRGGARGRPDRAGRHGPGGAAPPDGARQHLPAGEGRRRAVATTSAPATSPRCASWRCCGWPTGSTRRCSATATSTASTRPWETRERVVVALTGGPEGDTLIRRGRAHRAAARRAGLGPAGRARGPLRRPDRRLAGRLARAAGPWWRPWAGPSTRWSATTSPTRCCEFARGENATQLVLGVSPARPGGAVPRRPRRRRDRGAAVRGHRRAHGHPRALGRRAEPLDLAAPGGAPAGDRAALVGAGGRG